MRTLALYNRSIRDAAFHGAGLGAIDDNTEEGLFTAIAPDAMIVLDLSGSMKWNPPGDHDWWNSTRRRSTATPPARGPSTTTRASPGYTTYCSRFEIARKTLFNMLDDNHDGTVDVTGRDEPQHPHRPREVPGQHLHEAARHRDQVLPHLLRQQHLLHREPGLGGHLQHRTTG
ncbi:MAG: hypothetical protein MZV65_21035 [Chromatiales bacterium]|nr:hypothetical protein [Chromatiales bacterium]